MSDAQAPKTPVHLWIIGILALLWDAMGAVDYVMTETRNEAYMAQFTEAQLEFFYNFPAWLVAFWAIAVWGGLLGAILLLLRRKLALPVFIVSLISMVIVTIHNYGFAGAADIVGAGGLFFSVLIFVVAVFLVLYARAMAQRGVLR